MVGVPWLSTPCTQHHIPPIKLGNSKNLLEVEFFLCGPTMLRDRNRLSSLELTISGIENLQKEGVISFTTALD